MSWHMRIVLSIQTSSTWVVCTGLHLGLRVTVHCLGHNKPASTQLIPSGNGYPSPYLSACLDHIQHPHWRGTSPSHLTEVASRGWGFVPFFWLPCQWPLPCLRIPAAWLPCPLIPSYWPCYPSTREPRRQCAHLGGSWNLSTCLAAHSGTGIRWWSLALPASPALVVALAHWHPSLGDLISLHISIPNNILLVKLAAHALHGCTLSWIKNWLNGREQRVVVSTYSTYFIVWL